MNVKGPGGCVNTPGAWPTCMGRFDMAKGTRTSRPPAWWRDESRFWYYVDKGGPIPEHNPDLGPCWPWAGDTDDSGYGLFRYTDESGKRKRTRAHRWILGHLRGKPLTRDVVGLEDACHKCDYPPCCNPDHLYVGTRKQNIADAVERGRLRQQKVTHCPTCGSEYTYNPSGSHRRCKTCERAAQSRRQKAKTHCKNDHELTPENTLLCKNGTRKCRICDAERAAAASVVMTECHAQWRAYPNAAP